MKAKNSDSPSALVPSQLGSAQNALDPEQHLESQPKRGLPLLQNAPKPIWPIVTLGMVMMVGLAGWRTLATSQTSTDAESELPLSDPVALPVRVIEARRGLVQDWAFDEGTVWPVKRHALNFQADGDITFIAKSEGRDLREGDYVFSGQLLATVDSRKQVASIETADADVVVSLRQWDQADAQLLQAEARYQRAESDLALARTELQRYIDLFNQGAVSESDRDAFLNRVTQAETALQSAHQDIRSANDGLESAKAKVNASRARLRQSNVNLEDTQLISPIDGVVAYINIREGEYWNARRLNSGSEQTLVETAPIVIMDPTQFEVELDMQAEDASLVQPDQQVYVVLEEQVSAAQAGGVSSNDLLSIAKRRGSQGKIFSVSPSQTPGSRGTRVSIRNLLNVENLRVGGRVYVWIEVASREDTVTVPLGALLPRNEKYYAYVINEANSTVEQREVERGIEGLTGIEILSGIEHGERVVVEGQNRLVDGTPIAIVEQEGEE